MPISNLRKVCDTVLDCMYIHARMYTSINVKTEVDCIQLAGCTAWEYGWRRLSIVNKKDVSAVVKGLSQSTK